MGRDTDNNKASIYCIAWDVLKNLWFAVLVGVAVSLLSYVVAKEMYHPTYTSNTTLVVTAKGNTTGPYGNVSKIQKLTDLYEAVMDSHVLKKIVVAELGKDSFNGTVNINVVPETNLLTVSVTSDNPSDALRLLKTMLKCYPMVGENVLGEVVIEIFEEPSFPTRPDQHFQSESVYKKGFFAGFLLIIAWLAFLSYSKDTVKCSQDIVKKLDTTEFATLHHERPYKNIRSFVKKEKQQIFIANPEISFHYGETIKKIRTKLLFQMKKKNIKVIYVTSTVQGEGKSTVALNIAEAMSERFSNVLLIEGNIRKPSLVAMLEIPEESYADWSQTLVNDGDLEATIYKAKGRRFSLMLSNMPVKDSAEWLISKKMKDFVEKKKEEMDLIIIDGCSSLRSADSEVLASLSDASLLVVQQNRVPVKYINDTIDMLNGYGTGLMGCILNNVVTGGEFFTSGYGYGYGYTYKYGRYGKYGKYLKNDTNYVKGEEHESN